MQERIKEYWQISKPSIKGKNGMVASQHHLATDIGVKVLENGGNAMDAAVAAGLAIGVVEPWMSGIGGGGYTLIYVAKTGKTHLIEYGMRAPFESVPEDYPLASSGENSADSFNWPAVQDDKNVHGPLAAAVPGYIKGVSLALETFGTLSWNEAIDPACELAEWGLPIDWFSSQKINHFSRGLARYDETRRVYLADGLPPAPDMEGGVSTIQLGKLADTYRRLQTAGPEDFYTGEIAKALTQDLAKVGSKISMKDLAEYTATLSTPLSGTFRGTTIHTAGPLTGGISLLHALEHLASAAEENAPLNGTKYVQLGQALADAYAYRLQHLGEGNRGDGNTTHICVADAEGNVVSHTQTIMSAFGFRIMSPATGILMNNGMMWFDPKPGGPNSVVGGRWPLCNMCPTLTEKDGVITALGACGGRKIFPAAFQLIAFLEDHGMTVDEAIHQPRLDISGTDLVTVMDFMPEDIVLQIQDEFPNVRLRPNGVSPNFFALPQVIRKSAQGELDGGCFIPSPHAKVGVV